MPDANSFSAIGPGCGARGQAMAQRVMIVEALP
jgi:hypothetical protein